MADEKLLTVREVSVLLRISEKEVMDLAETGVIPAYKTERRYRHGLEKDNLRGARNMAEETKRPEYRA